MDRVLDSFFFLVGRGARGGMDRFKGNERVEGVDGE